MRKRTLIFLFTALWLAIGPWQATRLCVHCLFDHAGSSGADAHSGHENGHADAGHPSMPSQGCDHDCHGLRCPNCVLPGVGGIPFTLATPTVGNPLFTLQAERYSGRSISTDPPPPRLV